MCFFADGSEIDEINEIDETVSQKFLRFTLIIPKNR